MKKIFTILFSFGVITSSFAQYNQQQNKWDNGYANSSHDNYGRNHSDMDRHFDRENHYSEREKDFQIEMINRDFVYNIQAIQSDRYMRRHKKREEIRKAKRERLRKIKMVNARYYDWERGRGNHDEGRGSWEHTRDH